MQFFTDNQKKKLTWNRSELLLQDESPDKNSNGLEDCIDQDNLGEKLSRLSSLTLSSPNSTFQLNKRRADHFTKKKIILLILNMTMCSLLFCLENKTIPMGQDLKTKLIPKKKAAPLMVLPAHQPH